MAYFEQIEAYITGKLAPAERAAFEEQLKTDSNLSREVELQNDIINIIKSGRHAQLKSNLSKVPVGSAASSVSPWWIAAASGVIIIGAIGLYYIDGNINTQQTPIISKTVTETIPAPVQNTVDDVQIAENKESFPVVSAPEEKKPVKTSQTKSIASHKEAANTVHSPDVNMPDADITSSEIGNTVPIIKKETSISANQTLVEINDSDKSKFHYQSSNGKLTLYGNFKTSPYELIEIHGDHGNTVYLKFEKQYYLILNNQKQMHKLSAIHDKDLLSKLSKVNSK